MSLGFVSKRHVPGWRKLEVAFRRNPPYPLNDIYRWYLSLPFVFVVARVRRSADPKDGA